MRPRRVIAATRPASKLSKAPRDRKARFHEENGPFRLFPCNSRFLTCCATNRNLSRLALLGPWQKDRFELRGRGLVLARQPMPVSAQRDADVCMADAQLNVAGVLSARQEKRYRRVAQVVKADRRAFRGLEDRPERLTPDVAGPSVPFQFAGMLTSFRHPRLAYHKMASRDHRGSFAASHPIGQ